MKNYSENYLKVVSKIYSPNQKECLRYMRGEYMLKSDYKYKLIRELGGDAYLLYEFFYEKKKYNYFVPTDDEAIGKVLGWSASKVTRLKTQLKKAKYLLIIKGTVSSGTTLYQTLLGKELIEHYLETGTIIGDLELLAIEKDKQEMDI